MPKHAAKRPSRTRALSTRGAIVVGTFTAATCAAVTGTAHAAGAPASAPSTAPQTAPGTAAKTSTTAAPTYTVKCGDTLIGISRSQKVTAGWRAIARENHITSPYIIHPHEVLRLPTGSHPASSSTTTAAPAAATTSTAGSAAYTDDLDGWIKHSLAIMGQDGIPGSYDGIYRNIMRESSGNPNAINLWDSNAAAGHPSIGLLQVIQPTFDAYHVAGTSTNIYDPVANITAACNYAYHVYGSIDNVNGPY
ncbi:LysM domain-containing protein [Actinacidiphila yanglinensis]|uniref:LysM domain-containing protein n=1 Tax=Actinacidiphila yanglinensis TaxID=310779 RepID=A0A1H5VRL7_9ACTN|nr:transglycosylase SLT domain-containing protein [Actinacidiphila yanglinensis]SEF89880.1 LysM domain-containing protein [Actinacidiphila yanglinensis]